jgi:hypothetical protein
VRNERPATAFLRDLFVCGIFEDRSFGVDIGSTALYSDPRSPLCGEPLSLQLWRDRPFLKEDRP